MPADSAIEVAPPDLQTEDSPSVAPLRPADGASKLLKRLLFGFAATMTVGLALASWYVGIRIVAANELAPRTSTPPASPLAAKDNSIAAEAWHTVPQANLYLEVAGLGPQQDADFVRSVQAKGLKAQVQTRQIQNGDGIRDERARILIGPYSNHAEVEQARHELQSAGVLAVETAY
jgi:hypothetical protein